MQADDSSDAPATPSGAEGTGAGAVSRRRILVVDDDERLATVIAELLEDEGFATEVASGGDQALRALATRPFDLAVLDRHMPDIDGLEVLHWIRQQPDLARLPVVFLTADDRQEASVSGFREGADDYVVKPFDPDVLVARLRRRLEASATWTSIIELEAKRRHAMRSVAERAAAPGDVLSMASDLCEELARLPEVGHVLIVEVAGDVCGVIGSSGGLGLDLPSLVDGGPSERGRLIETLATGPRQLRLRDRDGHAAAAPIRSADAVVGFLTVLPPPGSGPVGRDVALGLATDFAALASGVLGRAIQATAARRIDQHRVERIIAEHSFHPLFAPVLDLRAQRIVGQCVRTRFYDGDAEQVYATADATGLGDDLRALVAREVARRTATIDPGQWLVIEPSPHGATLPRELLEALEDIGPHRVVLDLTGIRRRHTEELIGRLATLPDGVRLLVDEELLDGAVVHRPVLLHVPAGITHRLASDRRARAALAARRHLAREVGAPLLAADVPEEPGLDYFAELDIDLVHGRAVGKAVMLS